MSYKETLNFEALGTAVAQLVAVLPEATQQLLVTHFAKGMPLEHAFQKLVLDQIDKAAWHESRKPKEPTLKRPVGRPPLTSEQKQCRELAPLLISHYDHWRKEYETSEKYAASSHAAQEAELLAAIDADDLEKLLWFERTHPWTG